MKWRAVIAAAVVAVLAVTAGILLWRRAPERRLVAYFERTVGIHAGSDVRVLGVRIGRVVAVAPQGRTVRVELRYATAYHIPADAQALIIPPSVVSDRYVQLTPAYTGGPALGDGAEIPVERTAAPMEIEDIYRALDEFDRALGPGGVNADGALAELVRVGAANLDGNGERLHTTLGDLSKALGTLADGRADLFGSIANLQRFTTALARSDQQVAEFNALLADVATQLAGERDELAAALHSLATALAEVTSFVKQNRAALKSNVDALADITGVLVRQQKAIIDVLDFAPLALSNLNLAYNARSGTVDTRDNAMGPYDPASYICSLLVDLAVSQVPQECLALARTLQAKQLPLSDQLRRLLGLPPGVTSPNRPAPPPGVAAVTPGGANPIDRTLAGILRGTP